MFGKSKKFAKNVFIVNGVVNGIVKIEKIQNNQKIIKK
jgi:hypothetical protein